MPSGRKWLLGLLWRGRRKSVEEYQDFFHHLLPRMFTFPLCGKLEISNFCGEFRKFNQSVRGGLMASEKRYYWLKLHDDFFSSKQIKKLRKIAGGDTYTIIYLKMLLVAIKKGGILEYDGVESTFAEEIALEIDEDADNVQVTVNFLLKCGLAEQSSGQELILPSAVENTGSEGASAERMRKLREREKQDALPCSAALSQSDALPSQCAHSVTERKRKDKREKKEEIMADKPPRSRFIPPSIDEVKSYCTERGNSIDAQRFVDFYDANGWVQGRGKPIKDWKAAVRTWERTGNTGGHNEPSPAHQGMVLVSGEDGLPRWTKM